MAKSMTMAQFEKQWTALGGTVVRDRPGHVVFKFPGFAGGAVHSARSTGTDRTPRHLLSRLRRIQEGRAAGPRVEPVIETSEPEQDFTRVRFSERPWPEQELSTAPMTPEQYEAMRAVISELNATKGVKRERHMPTEAELTQRATERFAELLNHEQTVYIHNRIRDAKVIVGKNFHHDPRSSYGGPGMILVFWGTDVLDRARANPRAPENQEVGYAIDLSGATRKDVDAWNAIVGMIKGAETDLLHSCMWDRGQTGTGDAILDHVRRLKEGAVVSPDISIVREDLIAQALRVGQRTRNSLDLSDGIAGLGIDKVVLDKIDRGDFLRAGAAS